MVGRDAGHRGVVASRVPICWTGVVELDVIDHPDADPPARPASTVVLLRDADELEVLMIHRGAETAFGGMWAFPGGVIESGDVPPGTEPDPLPAARRAAARETHEEIGLHVDADSMVWWSHWLPPIPALGEKRFSTWFFVAPLAGAQLDPVVAVDGREVHDHRWLAPDVALGMQERGEMLVAPPTYVTLQQLCRYGDVATAVAAADPIHFATEIAFAGEVRQCLWAGDIGYGGGDPTADGPRHRLVMDDVNGWRYLNTPGRT